MAEKVNEYSRMAGKMSDEELLTHLHHYETYQEELLQAIIWETEKRQLPVEVPKQVIELIRLKEQQLAIENTAVTEEAPTVEWETAEDKLPEISLFSQTAILGFSLFFSPISGGILFALNLARLKRKGIGQVLLFSVVFTLFQGYVSMSLQPGSVLTLIVNVAGALIMSELLWNQYIGRGYPYSRRSIWIPLLIAIALIAPLAWYMYQHPEFLEQFQSTQNAS